MNIAAPRAVRLLVLGTGGMAANHLAAFRTIPGVEIVAGVDTRPDQLARFQAVHGIPHGFATVDAAIAWGEFDAVTNITPDAAHYATTLPLLAAGKHVLCEKPLATSEADAIAMAEAARGSERVTMVNLTYRKVAALQQAAAMVRAGAIGDVRHFEAAYLQSWLTQSAWGDWRTEPQWLWRLSRAHGSKGVLGDVGIHIIDFATHAAGQDVADVSCRLATFEKAPGGKIGDYVLDANDSATMQLRLANGALGTVTATRYATGHLNDLRLRLHGTIGALEMAFERGTSRLSACMGPNISIGAWVEVEAPDPPSVYDTFIAAIRGQAAADPDFSRGAALQAVLDRAEQSAAQGGLTLRI